MPLLFLCHIKSLDFCRLRFQLLSVMFTVFIPILTVSSISRLTVVSKYKAK